MKNLETQSMHAQVPTIELKCLFYNSFVELLYKSTSVRRGQSSPALHQIYVVFPLSILTFTPLQKASLLNAFNLIAVLPSLANIAYVN